MDIAGAVWMICWSLLVNLPAVICQQEGIPGSRLLVTDTDTRRIYHLTMGVGQFDMISLEADSNPVGVAYDSTRDRVYWTDVNTKRVNAKTIGDSSQAVISTLSKDSIADGIAVDNGSRLLYYTDAGRSRIAVLTLDGRYGVDIIADNLDKPRAICLDSPGGMMFWTDWGAHAHIGRAEMDGSNRRVLVQFGGKAWPNGLTVDSAGGLLYWCEARSGVIESSTLDGQQRRVVFSDPGSHFFGIAFLGKYIFYTDWTKRHIMKLDRTVLTPRSYPFGDAVFIKPNAIYISRNNNNNIGEQNTCSVNSGGCTQLCLPKAIGRQCACSNAMYLLEDGITCSMAENTTPRPTKDTWRIGALKDGIALPEFTTSSLIVSTQRDTNLPLTDIQRSASTLPATEDRTLQTITRSTTHPSMYTRPADRMNKKTSTISTHRPISRMLTTPRMDIPPLTRMDVSTAAYRLTTDRTIEERMASDDGTSVNGMTTVNYTNQAGGRKQTTFSNPFNVHELKHVTTPTPFFHETLPALWLTGLLVGALLLSLVLCVGLAVLLCKSRLRYTTAGVLEETSERADRQTIRSRRTLPGTIGRTGNNRLWNELYTVNAMYTPDSSSFCNSRNAKRSGSVTNHLVELFNRI